MTFNDMTKDTHNIHTNKLNTMNLYRYETKDTHNTHHKQIKYNDLYRYETKDTHKIHTNKLKTMTFRDMRPKTHTTYTQTN